MKIFSNKVVVLALILLLAIVSVNFWKDRKLKDIASEGATVEAQLENQNSNSNTNAGSNSANDLVPSRLDDIVNVLTLMNKEIKNINGRLENLEDTQLDDSVAETTFEGERGVTQDRKRISLEEKQQNQRMLREKMESDFLNQSAENEAWIAASEQTFQDFYSNNSAPEMANSQLAAVECRGQQCKVEIQHNDNVDTEDFEFEFLIAAARAGFPGARGYTVKSDGSSPERGIYYLSEGKKPGTSRALR